MFNRSTILRTAHAVAKRRMAPSQSFRYDDRWEANRGGYVPTTTYREVFALELRWAWRDAKTIAENEAIDATRAAVPELVRERVSDLRTAAWFQPINSAGNRRCREMLDEADAMLEAA